MMEQIRIFSTPSRNKMKKKNATLESALEKSDFSDTLAEHPAIQWISQNGRSLLWLILGLIALFLIGYRLMGGPSSGSAKDYFAAEKEMDLFLTGSEAQTQESLDKLNKLLKSYPDLQAKYDGRIAQKLIDRGAISSALPFADRTLARLSKEHVPFYNDYSATTLLIEKEQYPEALEQAMALQAKMNEKQEGEKFGSGLYAANQLRLAMLNQKLGKKSEELKSWQTLKQILTQGASGLSFEQVLQALNEGKLSLLDYIAFREKELKS